MKLKVSIEMDLDFSDDDAYLEELEEQCHDALADMMSDSFSADSVNISINIEKQ